MSARVLARERTRAVCDGLLAAIAAHRTREQILTDNCAKFQSAFHYHVLEKGIGHCQAKPRTPRLNGKLERSHHIDAAEFYALLDGDVTDDANVFNSK